MVPPRHIPLVPRHGLHQRRVLRDGSAEFRQPDQLIPQVLDVLSDRVVLMRAHWRPVVPECHHQRRTLAPRPLQAKFKLVELEIPRKILFTERHLKGPGLGKILHEAKDVEELRCVVSAKGGAVPIGVIEPAGVTAIV